MGRKKDDDIWGFLGGLLLGAIGVAILSKAINPICPNCRSPVKRGDPFCVMCGTLLEWK